MAIAELLILIVVGMVFVLVITAKQNRRHNQFFDRRTCRRCGAVHPSHANFCARCGENL
jgi:ribosomal protein L40E